MLTFKEWRRARGISAKEYAKALGVSETTVYAWENYKAKMPVDKAAEACRILGIKLDDVIILPKNATKCCSLGEDK